MFKVFETENGLLDVDLLSTGEANIIINDSNDKLKGSVMLSNQQAHELRDMLNERFPNATNERN